MAQFDQALVELKGVSEVWAELYSLLLKAKYPIDEPKPGIGNLSVKELNRIAIFVVEQLSAIPLNDTENPITLLLASRSEELRGNLKTFRKNAQAIVNAIKPQLTEGLTARDHNGNLGITIVQDGRDIAPHETTASFTSVFTALNTLLSFLLPLSGVNLNGAADMLERAGMLARLIGDAKNVFEQVKEMAAGIKEIVSGAAVGLKTIQGQVATAEAAQQKLSALQQQMDKEAASVTALVEKIKAIGTSADALEQQVSSYAATFKAFQEQLDEKNKIFEQFVKNTKIATEKNAEREAEIDRLTEKADSMIRGATTAGLSKSLEDSRDTYAGRMFWSRLGFLSAIIVLAVSAIPLVADLLPGLFGSLAGKLGNENNSILSIVAKICLLFPATWLTLFFAKSYSEFFHLEREYAHKAALAKSIEGFKREAPSFAEVITTSVFSEILSNPSVRPSPEPAQHPLYEALLNKLPDLLSSKTKGG